MRPKPILLLILDGWGHREAREWNAIASAELPTWRRLLAECPHTLIDTHGMHVGLPDEQMGNSEVGHMNIGAGRVVYQELTRIDAAIRDGSFAANPALNAALAAVRQRDRVLHVLGLVSPGGVHSHERHLHALLELAAARGVRDVAVHAFLDGRDTPQKSAREPLLRLQATCETLNADRARRGAPPPPDRHAVEAPSHGMRIATVCGRYYAMDRDQRWERTERAWRAIVDGASAFVAPHAAAALEAAYARGETDEFVQPTVLDGYRRIEDGDGIVFMNFRADRARQLASAFLRADFAGFAPARRPSLSAFVTLTEYAADLPVSGVAFRPQSMANTLGEYLALNGLTQLRIAETEKYAHVTFFLNGGRETPFPGEERVLVPSPKVPTYDLKPEMSLPELTEALVGAIRARRHDVIVCNIANGDMVGHTGVWPAALAAAAAVDRALAAIVAALVEVGGEALITADHGNLEQMREADGAPHTQHTVGPVPLIYVGRQATLAHGGALKDLAPTLLAMLGLPQPAEMSGRSLLAFATAPDARREAALVG